MSLRSITTRVYQSLVVGVLFIAPATASAAEPAHGDAHGGYFSSLFWYVVNFVLYAILVRVLYAKKAAPLLVERTKQTKQQIEKAALDLSRSEENLSIVTTRLKHIESEKQELLEQYEREGARMRQTLLEQAEAAARRTESDTARQIENERNQARKELRRMAVVRAVDLAREKLGRGLSDDDDRRLRNQVLREALF